MFSKIIKYETMWHEEMKLLTSNKIIKQNPWTTNNNKNKLITKWVEKNQEKAKQAQKKNY